MDAYPTPAVDFQIVSDFPVMCVPGWAWWFDTITGRIDVLNKYTTGYERKAWKTFKRWGKTHPKAKRRLMRKAAVCE
jgi:hypothetical protein